MFPPSFLSLNFGENDRNFLTNNRRFYKQLRYTNDYVFAVILQMYYVQLQNQFFLQT